MEIEKDNLKKNYIKKRQKKGISLIVLIVTIIVIIILASVVILTVSKNNPVESAREAKFKEDIQTFRDDLALSISKEYTSQGGQRDNKFSGTTLDEIQDYIPSFTKEYEGKFVIKEDELIYVEDKVTEKEKKWLIDLSIGVKEKFAKVVEANVAEYYGKSITNYEVNGVTDWKIFHSDGNNVYLIASDYVDLDKLPTTSAGNKPENTKSSHPKAAPFNNVIKDYNGSSDITDEKIKALNKSYFDYLEKSNTVSKNNNMKAVAYMLDTEIWSRFKSEKAEYVVGGPTVEMLMASYSKTHNVDYKAQATSATGYEISKDGGDNWANYYIGLLSTSDSLYVLPSSNGAYSMWLASPSANDTDCVMYVFYGGGVGNNSYDYTDPYIGFRPLVCLKSDVLLEADGEGYKIK